MSTLDIIRSELRRQSDLHQCGVPYFDDKDIRSAIIDGHVDLVALAAAIDAGKKVGAEGQIRTGD